MKHKKYKLIRPYPGIRLKVGTVVTKNPHTGNYCWLGEDREVADSVEGYPELWRELKEEPKYKVQEGDLDNADKNIISIKRLNDFEIFNVGDTIITDLPGFGTTIGTIYKFDVGEKDELYIRCKSNDDPNGFTVYNIENIKKAIPVGFTIDGSIIYEGEMVFKIEKISVGVEEEVTIASKSNLKGGHFIKNLEGFAKHIDKHIIKNE